MSFRYKKEIAGNSYIVRPKIPVTLFCGEKRIDVEALLDSGADKLFLPKGIADFLGVDYLKEDKTKGVGGEIKVGVTRLGLIIGNDHESYILANIPAIVPLNEKDDSFLLIGRSPFFDEFDILFKQRLNRVILTKAAMRRN